MPPRAIVAELVAVGAVLAEAAVAALAGGGFGGRETEERGQGGDCAADHADVEFEAEKS